MPLNKQTFSEAGGFTKMASAIARALLADMIRSKNGAFALYENFQSKTAEARQFLQKHNSDKL